MEPDLEHDIRHLAYHIWQTAGRDFGQTALDFWQEDVAAAVTLLTKHGIPPEAIAAFTTAARPENMMPAPDTPFADVQAYCLGQDQWFMHWNRRDFTDLAATLPGVLQ